MIVLGKGEKWPSVWGVDAQGAPCEIEHSSPELVHNAIADFIRKEARNPTHLLVPMMRKQKFLSLIPQVIWFSTASTTQEFCGLKLVWTMGDSIEVV